MDVVVYLLLISFEVISHIHSNIAYICPLFVCMNKRVYYVRVDGGGELVIFSYFKKRVYTCIVVAHCHAYSGYQHSLHSFMLPNSIIIQFFAPIQINSINILAFFTG